ncbi:hypothetical protein MWT96_20490 [Prescottella equi]|uniref:Uncharacterized protein n=1 Tax=Rhodococcus hoagii TaxID=43767 RepID=A0A9Q2SAF2_RHOHA|nr:hypothetical protein [Prescottella equi]MBM4487407.1 hypothetical protein [Prescottella equi]MBM4497595.1 hypothetical protein [Prescottella equi]MBM4549328.1 hypothetical protein [Prescottella equi]MBM4567478.1 hypothetical protein [Prescottella equi]MBM4594387.1 hypothetical protein [Prescottella equi]
MNAFDELRDRAETVRYERFMAAHHRMMAAVFPGLTTVAGLYARDGIDLPPAGREAHTPNRFRVHVSVLLAEAVAA